LRAKKKAELKGELLEGAGVSLDQAYTLKDLQSFATTHDIKTHVQFEEVDIGWANKTKGLLQVLWEWGWINEANLKPYTADGSKNPITGEIDRTKSLRRMLSKWPDFASKKTALQILGEENNIQVDRSPKFHAEIAGECIEFCWACAKNLYRHSPLVMK
jgi:hypothetical protein